MFVPIVTMLLFLSKLFVAWWITLMSAVGVWLPVFYVRRRSRDDSLVSVGALAHGRKASALAASAATRWYLSLANCVSAGMLLTMALLHFFPESFETGAAGAAPRPTSLCGWMLLGILIPAMLERAMKGSGGHNHGVTSESDGDHSHGEAGGSGGSGSSGSGATPTATLLIVLMCFHGVTEGLLLGFEERVAALLSAALPLSLHKFCDGLVIGVTVAKGTFTRAGDEAPCPPSVEADSGLAERSSRSETRFWRRLYQGPVGAWLLLTPITMVLVVAFSTALKGRSRDTSAIGDNHTSFSTPLLAVQALSSTLSGGGTRAAGSVSTLAAVQAMGSGSFVYIGLGILHGEDLKGVATNVALLVGVVLTGALFLYSSDTH